MPDNCVLRQIGDRDIYIGNWPAADPANHGQAFDHVLTVCRREAPGTTHHHPLVDGPGNRHATVIEALETARELYTADGTLLVNCQAGVSRSSTTIAAALAATEGMSFNDAVGTIRNYRPDASPTPALRAHAQLYLDGVTDDVTTATFPTDAHCVDCETPIEQPHVEGSFDAAGDPIHPGCADWVV